MPGFPTMIGVYLEVATLPSIHFGDLDDVL